MKPRKLLRFLLIFIILLPACNSTPATESVPTITATQILSTTIPSATASPTATSLATITASTTSLPISSAPDGLRMVYELSRNLYYQDGSHQPLQLTNNGEDWLPLFFSEDREKVFFLRGLRGNSLYSINIDGSQEQALVTNSLLLTFGLDYGESTTPCDLVLIPHTNLILFRTCSHPVVNQIIQTIYNDDLFVVNTDTIQVKNLLPRGTGGIFYISPDGKMLAIDRMNSIDILGIDGKVMRPNVATYPRSKPIPVHSFVYWTEDSGRLILALPTNTFYDTSLPPKYEIWRYSLDTGANVQIDLDPPPMSFEPIRVSPDGNWVTYNNREEHYFYLGNLRDSGARAYEMALPYQWSPDSIHFVYLVPQPGGSDLYLASVTISPTFVGTGEFIGWLDASRYVYFTNQTFFMGEIGREPMPILDGNTQHLYSYASIVFTYRQP